MAEDSDVQRHSVSILFQRARGIAPRYMSQILASNLTVCQSILSVGIIATTMRLNACNCGYPAVPAAVVPTFSQRGRKDGASATSSAGHPTKHEPVTIKAAYG